MSLRTPFHDEHVRAGAKVIDFAGWEMPVQYAGILHEHEVVRTAVGLFDLSHMGEIRFTGKDAVACVDRLLTNDVLGAKPGQCVYSPVCLPEGGVVDDVVAYRDEGSVILVVNAANKDKDLAWFRKHAHRDVEVTDLSYDTALLAVQGPRAEAVVDPLFGGKAAALGFYRFARGRIGETEVLVSRTGYTGEDGFEIYFHRDHASRMWRTVLDAGRGAGIEPIGLGARDTLRFEVGYCLYGNELDETTTPLEAGLAWTVKLDKGDFIGREALRREKETGPRRRLVGLEVTGSARIPRHGSLLLSGGREVGAVTSGTFAPSLKKPLALGYVEARLATTGTALEADLKGTRIAAAVTKRPFYTRGSRKG